MTPAARDHRIRLTDDDIALVVASLAARRATAGEARRGRIDRLVERLSQGLPGNPNFRRLLNEERAVVELYAAVGDQGAAGTVGADAL